MNTKQIQKYIDQACKRIAPAWSLENSIAVNPYLGFSDMPFKDAAEVLKQRGNIKLYMPIEFYLGYIEEGDIQNSDLDKALKQKGEKMSSRVFLNNIGYLKHQSLENRSKISTLQDIVEEGGKEGMSGIIINHTSEWLAAYFNDVKETKPEHLFSQWKKEASVDLLPELSGVLDFRETIHSVPVDILSAISFVLDKLKVKEEYTEAYLHTLLLKQLGWSSYCVGLDWQNTLYGKHTGFVKALLAVLLVWEYALLKGFDNVKPEWINGQNNFNTASKDNDRALFAQSVLQDAFDISFQRKMVDTFRVNTKIQSLNTKKRSLAQMVFCIDVRSEVYRRNLERVNAGIETLGFAGFFGFPVQYKPMNHISGRNQCPALIPSGPQVYETAYHSEDSAKVQISLYRKGILNIAWSKFKSGSVSSYSFVSPLGLFYLPKLVSDSFGWTRPVNDPKKEEFGKIISGKRKLDISKIPFDDRVNMAKSALSTMGLIKDFAPLVLITGHGSTSVNNPHASGLDCGACGGNSGEINAITAQLIFNDSGIREALRKSDIHIPSDTWFIACLHDTTTDEIRILNEDHIPSTHTNQLTRIKLSLQKASKETRKSRSLRFGIKAGKEDQSIIKRSKDWGQVRPEWGLAGCHSFVVAPRERTKRINLEGKTFLHSYSWQSDKDFKVLEAIMTAPMIVTSWINLQYYASTVDNERLGSGNKTLHNVTAGLGVLEGSNGDLRIGLPLQSVHDGERYQHLPLRLKVIIEAPIYAVNDIIQKHTDLKQLCDNMWITVMTMNGQGVISHAYIGSGNWEEVNKEKNNIGKAKLLEVTI